MRRLARLAVLASLGGIFLGACGTSGTHQASSHSTSRSTNLAPAPSLTAGPTTTTTVPPTTTTTLPQQAAAPINLSGDGQMATQPFPVAGGLTIFTSQCSCQGNFSVELDDSSGQQVALLANVIGAYNGAIAEGLTPGNYILNVDADSSWTVTVTQPRNIAPVSLPHTYTGTGDQVEGPFSANLAVEVQAQNVSTGGGNFSVTVLANDGREEALPFNAIGSDSGSTISNDLNGGPYWLNIGSDGNWTITISNP
jgi:hypothetical protein